MAEKHSAVVLWAREQSLPSSPKLVLLCLALRANIDWSCWPSIATLSKDTGLKDRAIRSAIKMLESKELIETSRRYNQSLVFLLRPALDAGLRSIQLHSALGAASKAYKKWLIEHDRATWNRASIATRKVLREDILRVYGIDIDAPDFPP